MRIAVLTMLLVGCGAPVHAQTGSAAELDMKARVDRLVVARKGLADCLAEQAVRLGARNTETGETVLKAAKAYCARADGELEAAYEGVHMGPRMIAPRIRTDRDAADNAAVASLLAARSTN